MKKEPDTSNASDRPDPLPRPKLSLRTLGSKKEASPGTAAETEKAASPPASPVGSNHPDPAPPAAATGAERENAPRPKLKLSTAGGGPEKTQPVPVQAERHSTLSLARKQPREAVDVEPEPENAAPLAPSGEDRAETPKAPLPEKAPPPPAQIEAKSKTRELAEKRAAESAKTAENNSKPVPKETISDEAFDALMGAEPAIAPAATDKTDEATERKVIAPVKSPSLNSMPPFDDSETGVERLIISTFPRRNAVPPKSKSAKTPLAVLRPADSQSLSIDPAPPKVTMDTIRPTVSLKAPPPADAPLHLGAVKKEKKSAPKGLIFGGIVALLLVSGAVSFFLKTSEPPAASTPAPTLVKRPATSTPAPVSAPTPDPVVTMAPTPASAGDSGGLQRSEELTILVNSLPISMVSNRGANSMLIIGGVAYRIGGLVDPFYELRFIGFTSDGKHIAFEDGNGVRYARSF